MSDLTSDVLIAYTWAFTLLWNIKNWANTQELSIEKLLHTSLIVAKCITKYHVIAGH